MGREEEGWGRRRDRERGGGMGERGGGMGGGGMGRKVEGWGEEEQTCRLHSRAFSISQYSNCAPLHPLNFSTRAVTSLLVPHTACISLCTIPMEC